jgi:hypothetical protein
VDEGPRSVLDDHGLKHGWARPRVYVCLKGLLRTFVQAPHSVTLPQELHMFESNLHDATGEDRPVDTL